jgi:hypothetical protein
MKLLESAERQDYSLDIEESDPIGRPIKFVNLGIQKPHNFTAKGGKNFSPFRKCDENLPTQKEVAKENKWKSKSQTPEANTPSSSQNLRNMYFQQFSICNSL